MIEEARLEAKVGELLGVLYTKRFSALGKLSLTQLINKNPYLYRAIGISDPNEFIDQLLSARISSSDETIFGNDFLEPLATWSASESDQHDGGDRTVTVSDGAGADITIDTATARLVIAVKSGKNIFNSQSTKGQGTEFDALQARMKKLNKQVRAIIGYGYGRKQNKKETVVERVAGKMFWELLTGEPNYYLRIARTIGKFSGSHGEAYKAAYARKRLQLQRSFMMNFVTEDGEVLWDNVVTFNSSEERPRRLKNAPDAEDAENT